VIRIWWLSCHRMAYGLRVLMTLSYGRASAFSEKGAILWSLGRAAACSGVQRRACSHDHFWPLAFFPSSQETIEPDQMSLPIQRAVDSRCPSHPLHIISLIRLNHAVWLTAQAQDGRVPYNSISASHENDALHMQACDLFGSTKARWT